VESLPSPCFVIDQAAVRRNLEILRDVREASGCRIVLAQKAFSLWHLYPTIKEYLDGACASGPWEAQLAHSYLGGAILTCAPAYTAQDIEELLPISHHLDFNSPGQWARFRDQVTGHPRFWNGELQCGLRVNPECSTGQTPLYDPCAPGSRLGTTAAALAGADLTGLTGLHFHTLCEQGADALEATLDALDEKFGDLLRSPQIRYLNMGGGHWITKPDYDRDRLIALIQRTRARYDLEEIWLEPGEAVAIHTGALHASVLDLVTSGGITTAILDVSATAHMPDVLEMPYRPDIFGPDGNLAGLPGTAPHVYRLGGPTCLAGDVIGEFAFSEPLEVGDRLIFDDMAHYTMVKTTMFNGVRHPAIALRCDDGQLVVLREFSYEDFRARLG
jgi:carboxynorspermidine decarboxylase